LAVDLAGFGFRNPSDPNYPNDKQLAFYLGYFGATGTWNPSAGTASSTAALAEVVGAYYAMSGYHNNDGVAGFQWVPGNPLLCVNGSVPLRPAGLPATDCLEYGTWYDLRNTTWTPITYSTAPCPTGYNANCTVHRFRTATTDAAFAVTFKLASEPVLVDGARVTPQYGKIDININFPWSSFPTSAFFPNLRLAVLGAYAGKALAGVAAIRTTSTTTAAVFVAGKYSNYFEWDGSATVNSAAGVAVHTQAISGTTIRNMNCVALGCDLLTLVLIAYEQGLVTLWNTFNWSVEFVFFSIDQAQPASFVWDPKIGYEQTATSLAVGAPSLVIPLVIAFIASFF